MANLVKVRRSFTRAIIALLAVDFVAVVLLLSPFLSSTRAHEAELDEVRAQVRKKSTEVIPPDQIQQRIDQAREEIKTFYQDRLPSEYSAIPEEIGKLASDNQVKLTKVTYRPEDTDIKGLRRVSIDSSITGNYLQEVKFINALERAHIFFVVDSVTLGQAQSGAVQLQLKLDAFLKGQS